MDRLGFRADTVKKVEQGLFRELRKKAPLIESLTTGYVKEAFGLFGRPPVDTQETQNTTYTQVLFDYKNVIIRFKSENRGDYAQFPLLGESTSEKYGARNWLIGGRELTTKRLFRKF